MRKVHFNRTLALLMWVQALCVALVACSDSGKDEPTPEPEPSKPGIEDFNQGNMDFSEKADSKSFTFTANADWTATAASTGGEAWCTLSPSNGKPGAQTVAVNVTDNEGYDDRSVTVTVKAGNSTKSFVVTQKQKNALLLTSDKFEVEQKGGTIKVEVKANVSYTATIGETCKDWIKEGSDTRALSTTTKVYTVAANEESEKREGTITFSDGKLTETVHIYQAGGDLLLLTKNEFYADDKGEELTVELRSNCEYEVVMPEVDWVKAVTTRALSSHTLRYTVLPNTGYDARKAQIIYRSKKDAERADTLTITQGQKDAIILSQKEITAKAEGETLEVKLSANVDYEVVMPKDAGWITSVDTRALTEHTLYYKVAKNEADDSRSAKITFTNKESGVEEVLMVTQKGNLPTPITLHVPTPGDLPKMITGNYDAVKSLVLTGDLNGTDIDLIGKLYELAYLDMSGANIVEGGTYHYWYSGSSQGRVEVKNNIIGQYMFCNCRNFKSVVLPKSVVEIKWSAFIGCSSLESIIIPEGVTSIGGEIFRDCSSLENIIIPEGVTSIGNSTFWGCSSLKNITIPEGVTTIGEYTFYKCSSLENITLPKGLTTIEYYVFSGCSSLKNITIPEGVTTIESYAFNGCSSLENITIPKGVTAIGGSAFEDCSSLKNITIPEGVTSIGGEIFRDCSSLENITLPEGVTSIGYGAFFGCSSLKNLTIPKGVTTIGKHAFKSCKSLVKMQSNAITPPTIDAATTFWNVAANCELYVPKGTYQAYFLSPWGSVFSNIKEMEE